ncbi:MAG TPA: FAD-binding protein, partial [Deltaproteobacteria bacterium]|nr:FAD-binding protein [Deltaproteobacteria bacterium]
MKHSVDEAFGRQVQQIISGEVFFNEPMDHHASLGVGGKADVFACPENERELVGLVGFLVERRIPFCPVGNCTNLVVRDGGYRGVLISLKGLQGVEIRMDSAEETLLYAEAGVSLARLTELALQESLAGLEFCAGIPGTLGGALRMNAGAWGSEMKDIVSSVRLLAPGREIEEIPRSRLSFSYRNLDFSRSGVITAALLALNRGRRESIRARVE